MIVTVLPSHCVGLHHALQFVCPFVQSSFVEVAFLFVCSPVKDSVVTNDRWGTGTVCHHGGYFTCSDHYNPGRYSIYCRVC